MSLQVPAGARCKWQSFGACMKGTVLAAEGVVHVQTGRTDELMLLCMLPIEP